MRTLKTPVHSWTMNINYSGLEVYYLILYRYILWRKNNFSPWITENTALYWSVESLFSHSSPRVSFILIKKNSRYEITEEPNFLFEYLCAKSKTYSKISWSCVAEPAPRLRSRNYLYYKYFTILRMPGWIQSHAIRIQIRLRIRGGKH